MKLYLSILAILLTIRCTYVNDNYTSEKSINTAEQIYKPLITFDKDTNNYLKENFVLNKAFYIGKKFKIFRNTLEIPIVQYSSPIEGVDTKTPIGELGISTRFYTITIHDLPPSTRVKGRYCTCLNFLYIIFDKPLNIGLVERMCLKNSLKWTKEEDAYFDDMVIKDIRRSD